MYLMDTKIYTMNNVIFTGYIYIFFYKSFTGYIYVIDIMNNE
jgi:hypothetical protein